jgi:hypothetical protein
MLAKKLTLVNNTSIPTLKPLKRKSKRTKDHLELNLPEGLIDKVGELKDQIKNLEVEYKTLLADVHAEFSETMKKLEMIGEFETTMVAKGEKYKATITRKNQFSKIDYDESEVICAAIGEQAYDSLIDEKVTASLKGDWFNFAAEATAKGFDNIHEYFELTQYLMPKKNALETRAQLRGIIEPSHDKCIDDLIGQIQYKPSVRMKK